MLQLDGRPKVFRQLPLAEQVDGDLGRGEGESLGLDLVDREPQLEGGVDAGNVVIRHSLEHRQTTDRSEQTDGEGFAVRDTRFRLGQKFAGESLDERLEPE